MATGFQIYEGDTIVLYSIESKGFVYSQPPSHVTIYPVPSPQSQAYLKDPVFPNVHFASFQVLPENSNLHLENYSSPAKLNDDSRALPRGLVYGRKIKLLHVASKKYLSFIKPDQFNNLMNPMVTLIDKADGNCLFRILHSRSGKHRGEDVNSEDSIKLECVCKKNHFLLCTLNTLKSKYELKMAVADSTFTIYSQSTALRRESARSIPHNALKGGDVLLLYYVKKEAYLSGCGSIVMEYLPNEIKEDRIKEVGARQRHGSHAVQKAPPISGDSFWQLEKTDNPLCNDVFHYNDKCRLKHLPTHQYLAVVETGSTHELTLKQLTAGLRNDPQVTFSLISATKGVSGCVTKGSYVELRHIGTGRNLVVQSRHSLEHSTSTEDEAVPTSKNAWFKLVLEDNDESKKQYFRMEEVSEVLIHEYYHVSGVVSVLREYIQKFTNVEHKALLPPVLDELTEVVQKLSEWIGASSENQKTRANMLRVAEGIDLLVAFLHEITDYSNNKLWKLCCSVSATLKKYVEGSNKKSCAYLGEKRLLDILLSKIGRNIGVEQVLSALIKDEIGLTDKIVSRLTSTDPIHASHILSELDSSTLDFLSSLCFAGGKPSCHLQKKMCDYVLKTEQFVLYETKVVDGVVQFISPDMITGSVKDVCSNPNSNGFKFFATQLKFFSRICKGVNSYCIEMLTEKLKLISFNEALICINDEKLHPLIRSAYLDFVISAFVDRSVEESGIDIDNWHSFCWDEIDSNPSNDFDDVFDHIPHASEIKDLQKSIRTILDKNKTLYADGNNHKLLTVMLSMMETLVAHGFYWKEEDITKIAYSLIDILDGSNDKPSENADEAKISVFRDGDRYKKTHREMFKVKARAVNILHRFLKQLNYMALSKAVYDFKALADKIEVSPDDPYTPISEGLGVLLDENYTVANNPSTVAEAQERLRFYHKESAYPFFDYANERGKALVKILMDLMKYENDELRLSSTELLFDIFQEEKILFANAKRSYLITSGPAASQINEVLEVGSLRDKDKILLRMMQGKAAVSADDELNNKVVNFLRAVSAICVADEDELVPNYSSQWITYSCGIFQAILTYILSYSLTDSEPQKELLDLACLTLQRIIRGNEQIQTGLFSNFLDLIGVKTAVVSVAKLLAECLSGNVTLCRKLSEADLKLIYQTANGSQTVNGVDYHEFYVVLETMIRVNKSNPVLLKKQQDLLSHIIADSIPEYFHPLLVKTGRKERLRILTEPDKDNPQLSQLLHLSDLLASCAEGHCKFADQTCQAIFTQDELLSILSDKTISFERKKPFARLLDQAYLNTERDSLAALSFISKHEGFWTHIEECSIYINSLRQRINRPGINLDTVRRVMQQLFAQHMSLRTWLEISKDIDISVAMKFNEDDDEHELKITDDDPTAVPMNVLLLYICDGIIPLITSICSQLEIQNSSGLTSEIYSSLLSSNVIAVLKSIGEAISQLVLLHRKLLLTNEAQVSLFKGCLESLVFVLPRQSSESISESREKIVSVREKFFQSTSSEDLPQNEKFRVFTKNFELAHNSMSRETNNYEGNVIPAECSSFQRLVNVFINDTPISHDMKEPKLDEARNLIRILDILYRQLQLPLTGGERAKFDSLLLTVLQVLSGVVQTPIDSIDGTLQSDQPKKFEEEYVAKVKPIQDRLVYIKSHEKVMTHLSHPDDEIAVQVLEFLGVLLYLGNTNAQKKIGRLTGQQNTMLFTRISQLLEGVITSLGRPTFSIKRYSKKCNANGKTARKQTMQQSALVPPPANKDHSKPIEGPSCVGRGLEESNEQVVNLHHESANGIELATLKAKQQKVESAGLDQTNGGTGLDDYDDSYGYNSSDDDDDNAYGDNGSSLNDNDDDTDDDDDDESYLEDTTEPVKRMARRYDVLGTGQLETTVEDALKRASIVLDLVSRLCDGQNREMQEILRKQGFAFSNRNIVAEVAVILQTLAEHMSFKNMPIIKKAIQALIEMCAGNYVNQETAFKGQVIDSINAILASFKKPLSKKKPSPKKLDGILEVIASAIELLEVLLEETDQSSFVLAQGISDDLSVSTLFQVMLEISEIGDSNEQLKATAERAVFKGYHVLKKIADYLDVKVDDYVQSKYPKFSPSEAPSMWLHLGNWSRSIEVNYVTKDNKEILTKVHFPFDPSKELSEADKDVIKDKIDREPKDDKVKDLLKWMESIKINKRHCAFIKSHPWLVWTIFLSETRHFTLMFLTLLLNLLVLFLFEVPQNLQTSEVNANGSNLSWSIIRNPVTPDWYSNYALYVLGVIHLLLALWMVIEYFVVQAKNFLFSVVLLQAIVWDLKKRLLKNEAIKNFFISLNKRIFNNRISINPPEEASCFEVHAFSFPPLYRLFFVLCSILALTSHGYFYCGCLLYLFVNSSILEQILTALRRSILQLIIVGLLGAAIILIYAVLSFAFFHEFFDPNGDDPTFCDSLWQCFISVSRGGLLDTLGTVLPVTYVGQKDPDFTMYAVRTIFDLSFFVIITTLGLNIVIAILVDRFSELREEKEEIRKDKLDYCFICGIESDTFQRKAKGFRHHIQNDHCKWNYIYFVLHLDSVYKNDYNALEKYVFDDISEKSIRFFPLQKAKVLKDKND